MAPRYLFCECSFCFNAGWDGSGVCFSLPEFIQPVRERPRTDCAVARRMVTRALGLQGRGRVQRYWRWPVKVNNKSCRCDVDQAQLGDQSNTICDREIQKNLTSTSCLNNYLNWLQKLLMFDCPFYLYKRNFILVNRYCYWLQVLWILNQRLYIISGQVPLRKWSLNTLHIGTRVCDQEMELLSGI